MKSKVFPVLSLILFDDNKHVWFKADLQKLLINVEPENKRKKIYCRVIEILKHTFYLRKVNRVNAVFTLH